MLNIVDVSANNEMDGREIRSTLRKRLRGRYGPSVGSEKQTVTPVTTHPKDRFYGVFGVVKARPDHAFVIIRRTRLLTYVAKCMADKHK